MEARHTDLHAVILPDTTYGKSRLGDIIDIDPTGEARVIANLFKPLRWWKKVKELNHLDVELLQVREEPVPEIWAAATGSLTVSRMSKEQYSNGVVIDSSTFIDDCIPDKPFRAYQIGNSKPKSKRHARVFIAGPGLVRRTLMIDKDLAQKWVMENKENLEDHRHKNMSRETPQLLLVLQEWRTNTWLGLTWNGLNSIKPTKVACVQPTPEHPPFWGYFGQDGEKVQTTFMSFNIKVTSCEISHDRDVNRIL